MYSPMRAFVAPGRRALAARSAAARGRVGSFRAPPRALPAVPRPRPPLAACALSSAPTAHAHGEPHRPRSGERGGRRHSSRASSALSSALALGLCLFGTALAKEQDGKQGAEAAEASAPGRGAQADADAEEADAVQWKTTKYDAVIVGAGTAAYAALLVLKKEAPDIKVLVIGAENDLPYQKPVLSKELLVAKDPLDGLRFPGWDEEKNDTAYFEEQAWYDELKGVTLRLGTRAVELDATGKRLLVTSGAEGDEEVIVFDRCLIATGSTLQRIAAEVEPDVADRVHYPESAASFRRLFGALQEGRGRPLKVAVVGDGILSAEMASSLQANATLPSERRLDLSVVHVSSQEVILQDLLPPDLAAHVADKMQEHGVTLLTKREVERISRAPSGRVHLKFKAGECEEVDHVVVAGASQPNVGFASFDLEVDKQNGGLVVNQELEARSGIYVAGDAASYYDPTLGRRRLNFYEHAVTSGSLAGENMLLKGTKPYRRQPTFWSELGPDMHMYGVGVISNQLKTVSVWLRPEEYLGIEYKEGEEGQTFPREEIRTGVVYYLHPTSGQLLGVLLWNCQSQNAMTKLKHAKRLIMRRRAFQKPSQLTAQIEVENPLDALEEAERAKVEAANRAERERAQAATASA